MENGKYAFIYFTISFLVPSTYPIRGSCLGVSISVHDVTKEKANQIDLNTTIWFEVNVIHVFFYRLLPTENRPDCHYITDINRTLKRCSGKSPYRKMAAVGQLFIRDICLYDLISSQNL